MPDTVVITGASSGIGAALARHYAGSGVCLGLLGRDPTRLARVADDCRRHGAQVETGALDIRERRRIEIRLRKSVPRDASLDALSGVDALTRSHPRPMLPIVTRPYPAPLNLTPGR